MRESEGEKESVRERERECERERNKIRQNSYSEKMPGSGGAGWQKHPIPAFTELPLG